MTPSTHRASITLPHEPTAKRVVDTLSELYFEDQAAFAAFERPDGRWDVTVHFAEPPDQTLLREMVGQAVRPDVASTLVFDTVEAKDWVKASLEDLVPVAAGRFIVHGQHDRHMIPPNKLGIEIEAALAFGTGHHGTTRGCLLLLDHVLKAYQPRRVLDLGTGTGVLGIVALWEKLEEVTGKPRSRKHKYKLTQEEQSAWRESEEARRAATQTAREHALAQNQESRQAFEAEVARHDAAVEAGAAARATLGTLSSVRCDPPQSIGPGQIVFATAARCSYVSMPTESQPPSGGAACAKPVSFSVAAQWGLDAPGGASCVADGSASLVLPDDATPADLQALFAEEPVQLARLRRDR